MARSDKEKKEIYDKWKGLINMSQDALEGWAKNPARLEASLNRAKAKEEGGIQSGLDSLHRIKRRKSKPVKDWTDADYDNAAQENGFNGRMLGGKIGQPVGSTGMSKWEISLRNWGHDPALSSSSANSKYKAWKKSNKDAIMKSKAKKAKELIPYGRAKGMKPSDFDPNQIEKGKEIELEHTNNPNLAREIAMDHLTEIPNYYTHLEEMEQKAKKAGGTIAIHLPVWENGKVTNQRVLSNQYLWEWTGRKFDVVEIRAKKTRGLLRKDRIFFTDLKQGVQWLQARERVAKEHTPKRMEDKTLKQASVRVAYRFLVSPQ